jgi:hypothetical protein
MFTDKNDEKVKKNQGINKVNRIIKGLPCGSGENESGKEL